MGKHAVTALIETSAHAHGRRVRRSACRWEDWDFYRWPGGRVGRASQPLLVYRQETGTVRASASLAQKDTLLAVLRDRYAGYATGGETRSTIVAAAALLMPSSPLRRWRWQKWRRTGPAGPPDTGITEPAVVRMEFTIASGGAGVISATGRAHVPGRE